MKEERNKTLQQQTTDKYNRFQVVTIPKFILFNIELVLKNSVSNYYHYEN